jgi:hypothetical protein
MKLHENSNDVNVRRIFWVAIIMIVAGAVIHLAVGGMFAYYRAVDERRDVRQTLIEPVSPIPPEPRLEVDATENWETYRRSQREILNSYGWVSREQGRVRIPIERAMEAVAKDEVTNAPK